MSDIILLIVIVLPLAICLLEFLTVPSHIKWLEYEGRIITVGAPSVLLVFFLYENECIL